MAIFEPKINTHNLGMNPCKASRQLSANFYVRQREQGQVCAFCGIEREAHGVEYSPGDLLRREPQGGTDATR